LLAVDLHEHLIEMPAPVFETAHPANPLPTDVACEQRAEPVPPLPHRLMADIDPTLEEQVFHIPQAQREADVHHHDQADDLRR
jgi:hypothetical protein